MFIYTEHTAREDLPNRPWNKVAHANSENTWHIHGSTFTVPYGTRMGACARGATGTTERTSERRTSVPRCSCQRAMAAAGGAIEGRAQNGAQSMNFGFAPHAPLFHRRSCAFSYAPKKTKPPIVIQPKRGTTPAKSAPAPSSATIVRRPRSVPSPL